MYGRDPECRRGAHEQGSSLAGGFLRHLKQRSVHPACWLASYWPGVEREPQDGGTGFVSRRSGSPALEAKLKPDRQLIIGAVQPELKKRLRPLEPVAKGVGVDAKVVGCPPDVAQRG